MNAAVIPPAGSAVQKGKGSMLRHLAIALAAVVAAAPAAEAKEWAQKMFKATSHDFGHVARGAKAEFAFEIQNLYEEDVHIADVRTSCGCTTPTITKPTLKTWEKGAIVATLQHQVVPRPAEFDADGRDRQAVLCRSAADDRRLYPFGRRFSARRGELWAMSPLGAKAEQKVPITYRGRGAWQIADVRSANDAPRSRAERAVRQPGQISYKMTVRLKDDAPAGTLQDQLTLVTSDQKMPHVALPVEGRVVPPLSVSPSPLLFGRCSPARP